MDAQVCNALVRPLIAGRHWMIAVAAAAEATGWVRFLSEQGALRSFVLAGSTGTGSLPSSDHAEVEILGLAAEGIMDGIRSFHGALTTLPAGVVRRLDAWDPDRTARVLVASFTSDHPIAGRRPYGARRVAWERLEDKMTVDALWDAAEVDRAPSRVVPIEQGLLLAAAAELDEGNGTVWVGDNRPGWHGGADRLRWVRTREDGESAVAFLAEQHCFARVMPFLRGVPCSIHGMVYPGAVITFRPVEMMVFAVPGMPLLRYAGFATFWDPPENDREYMRETARRVGRHLRREFGYRGGFTVDGVLTERGFLPTELNARGGGGLGAISAGAPDVPLGFLLRALVAGDALEYRPAALEDLVLDGADRRRGGGGHLVVADGPTETVRLRLAYTGEGFRRANDDEDCDGTLDFGPALGGGFVRFRPDPDRTPVGPSPGERVLEAFRFADSEWGTGIGPLQLLPGDSSTI
jgi:hypothetical protein